MVVFGLWLANGEVGEAGGARGVPGRSWELWLDTASKGSKTPINRWVN